MTYPNGLQSQFTLDNLNRVTSLNNAKLIYDYTLDAAGNRRQVVEHLPNETGRTVNWSYDNIYRLTDEVISLDPHSVNGNVHYDLDPVGNRTQETSTLSGLLPGSFTYDFDDRLNTETYDADGNTLTSGGKTFAYDFENRLTSMTAGSVTVTIQYDADGNRVAKTVNGVTTRYLVDDLNPTGYAQVVEEVTAGAVTRQYTYGLQRISQTQQIANAWTPAFYGYDGAGTVRLLTDSSGTVTDTYDYDAWGNTVNTTGSTPNVYLYRGEQYDSDLMLYDLRARYFNPITGRFLTKDPDPGHLVNPATIHKYLYANSNPVGFADPSGRSAGAMAWPKGGDMAEYFELALIAVRNAAIVAAVGATAACTATFEFSYDVGFELPDLGKLNLCKACNPPVGTECEEAESGHVHHGWDPHYHLWKQGIRPDRTCVWQKINDKTTPISKNILSCWMYGSWVLQKLTKPSGR